MAIDCITCGKSMPDDADFCPHCGRAVVWEVAEGRSAPDNAARQSAVRDLSPTAERAAEAKAPAAPDKASAVPTPVTAQPSPLPPPQSVAPLPPPMPAAPPPTPKPSPVAATRPAPPRITTPSRSIPPRVPGPPPSRSSGSILTPPVNTNDRFLGAIAYLTFLPAVAFLILKQYKRRQFIRFHARQSIFFWILVAALAGLGLLASTLGFLLVWIVTSILVVLALALTWLVLSIKALQGEWFELPGLGNLAQHFGG